MNLLSQIDWAAILKIVGLDIMLGVDNAIVIAMACAALPAALRLRAILWGTAGAIGLRAGLLAFAGVLMSLPFVKLLAGAYLVYLGYKLLSDSSEEGGHDVPAADRVFTAVKTVIVADFMMSLDNVMAVAGAATGAGAHSTVYAICGVVLSIPVIVFGATGLMSVMNRFPVIVWFGGGLLGWVGAEMLVADDFVGSSGAFGALHDVIGTHAHTAVSAAGFVGVIVAVLINRALKKSRPAASVAA